MQPTASNRYPSTGPPIVEVRQRPPEGHHEGYEDV